MYLKKTPLKTIYRIIIIIIIIVFNIFWGSFVSCVLFLTSILAASF